MVKKTIVVNASGHGATPVFGGQSSTEVRGDLVLLRLPTNQVSPDMRLISEYNFLVGSSHYVFFRYSMDENWLEVVLGGTFLQGDNDLSVRPETVSQLLTFWLSFSHFGSTYPSKNRVVQKCVNRVMRHLDLFTE